MRDSVKENLHIFFRHRIPLVTTLLFMMFSFMPVNSSELSYFRPAVGMICVYYWTLKRGYMFSYISAFIIGLVMDIYSSTPLGLNIIMMMLLVFFTNSVERYFKAASFVGSWLVFAVIGLGVTLLKWLIFMIYFRQFVSLAEIMLCLLSTVMFYPLVVYLNIWIQNNLLPQERINE